MTPCRSRSLARAALLGALAVAMSGCSIPFGPTPATFQAAQRPAGVAATLRLPDGILEGELLEVRDSALLLLTALPARVVLVQIAAIEAGQFEQVRERIIRGDFRSDADRRVIRRLSRFPAGIPAAALSALLESHGQTAPDVVP